MPSKRAGWCGLQNGATVCRMGGQCEDKGGECVKGRVRGMDYEGTMKGPHGKRV
jgi:hypothetical protein